MKFKDGKTISAYVRSKLHSSYITLGRISHSANFLPEYLTVQTISIDRQQKGQEKCY